MTTFAHRLKRRRELERARRPVRWVMPNAEAVLESPATGDWADQLSRLGLVPMSLTAKVVKDGKAHYYQVTGVSDTWQEDE